MQGSSSSALALPTEGPDWRGHREIPGEVQGKEEAEGSAGDSDLPFLICKSLGEKDWLWSLAVRSSQMPRLSGVFAQSSGCAALQYQAQEELLLLKGDQNFLNSLPQSSQPQSQGSSASLGHHREAVPSGHCSLCSTTFMLAKDLS